MPTYVLNLVLLKCHTWQHRKQCNLNTVKFKKKKKLQGEKKLYRKKGEDTRPNFSFCLSKNSELIAIIVEGFGINLFEWNCNVQPQQNMIRFSPCSPSPQCCWLAPTCRFRALIIIIYLFLNLIYRVLVLVFSTAGQYRLLGIHRRDVLILSIASGRSWHF